VGASLLLLVSPIMSVVAVMVRIRLGSPIFFRQERPGLGEQVFTMLKFRTMTDARDRAGVLLSDRERITPLGRFLRRSSLDELPELINVVKGEMSLVGPRPLLVDYLPFYTDREKMRHTVRPGITGLAQVNGRNFIPWDERLELDAIYAERVCLGLDLQIMLHTISQVVRSKNVAVIARTTGEPLSVQRKLQLRSKKTSR
jgi:undecaprenyl phosphate N,N'-diacetylbacillosamine 1-phosphate transferase